MATTSLDEKLELIKQARNDIQTALQNKGQAVNTDIRTYAEAINNITGTSGIKLFSTEEELNASTDNNEGDIAEVYSVTRDYFTADSAPSNGYDDLVTPDKIILNEACTESTELMSISDNSAMMYGYLSISATQISFRIEGQFYGTMTYTSSDGITYTKDDTSTIKDVWGRFNTISTTVTCNNVDLVKQIVYQEIKVNKLYIYEYGAWAARDMGGTATANKVLKGYNIFKKNELIEGTYVAPTKYNYYETIFGVKTENVLTSYESGAGGSSIFDDLYSYSVLKLRPDTVTPTHWVPFSYAKSDFCLKEMGTGYINGSIGPSSSRRFLPISQTTSDKVGLCYTKICSTDTFAVYDTYRFSVAPYTSYTEIKVPKSNEGGVKAPLYYSDTMLIYPMITMGSKVKDSVYNYTVSIIFYNLTDKTTVIKDITTTGSYEYASSYSDITCRVINGYLIVFCQGVHIYDLSGNEITSISSGGSDGVLNNNKLYMFSKTTDYKVNVRVIDCTSTPVISDEQYTGLTFSTSQGSLGAMPKISFENTTEIDIGKYKFNTETFALTELDTTFEPQLTYVDQMEKASLLLRYGSGYKLYSDNGVETVLSCDEMDYPYSVSTILIDIKHHNLIIPPWDASYNSFILYQPFNITGIDSTNEDTITVSPIEHEFLMSYTYSSNMMGPSDSYRVIGTPYMGFELDEYGKNSSALSTEEYNTAIEIAKDIKGNQ